MGAPDLSHLFDRPLLIVSGKGGTGKSTAAAALAAAAAGDGRRVLLILAEGRPETPRALGLPEAGFQEAATSLGFDVLSITSREAAEEYLRLFSGLPRVGRSLVASSVLDQVVEGAPGLRDLLVCGKLYEITTLRAEGHPKVRGRATYDLVVVDGPPTGQIAEFLSAPAAFAELIRVGRMRRQVSSIARMIRTKARLVVTALPEEMAVAETLEAAPAVAKAGVPVTAVVANRCVRPVLPRGTRRAFERLSASDVASAAAEAGADLSSADAENVLEASIRLDRRHRAQQGFLEPLQAVAPLVEVPDESGLEGADLVRAVSLALTGDEDKPDDATKAPPPDEGPQRDRPQAFDAPAASLQGPLGDASVIIVCGSGGVGKTTVSAAIAVHLAGSADRAALLTVDPARRLASALRLPVVPGQRTPVPIGGGRHLEAQQLDTQRTFDELIERHGGSRERKDRILDNRFYRRISNTLAGTHEYMAMEKLYELADEEDHDAIVIDTPPTRSALSFLDAPQRLTDFLGSRFLRVMISPGVRAGRLGLSAARIGATAFLRAFGRLLGAKVLSDTAEFLAAFEGMYGGFKERAEQVLSLLRSDRCAFVVVASPSRASLEEAGYFIERLTEGGMRPAAVVVNRWHGSEPAAPPGLQPAVARLAAGDAHHRAVAAVFEAVIRGEPRRRAEREALSEFTRGHADVPIQTIPELDGDVHDVAGVRRVARALFEPERPERGVRR
jgi:anion-transporting  ArsA/GET3 family ATPase